MFLLIPTTLTHLSLPKYDTKYATKQDKKYGVLSHKQVACLATNVYYEARGEGYLGMLAVAKVTLNRVKSSRFGNTICKVVFQPHQFSWTIETTVIKYDKLSWRVANDALYTRHALYDFDALYFHNHTVRPNWGFKRLLTIQNHIFY